MTGVALLRPPAAGDFAAALAAELRRGGHHIVDIEPRAPALDALLRVRKVGDDLGRVAPALLALRRAGCAVAHAFTPADGLATGLWSAHGGGAAVLTVGEVPRREQLAARRLRLATLVRALERSAAVVAVSDDVRDGLERWLGARALVVEPEPLDAAAAAYAELYARLAC